MSELEPPEGMISVEDFAKRKGLIPDHVVAMIKDGVYVGRVIGEQWYVDPSAYYGASTTTESKTGTVLRVLIWLVTIMLLIVSAFFALLDSYKVEDFFMFILLIGGVPIVLGVILGSMPVNAGFFYILLMSVYIAVLLRALYLLVPAFIVSFSQWGLNEGALGYISIFRLQFSWVGYGVLVGVACYCSLLLFKRLKA